jgi:hypothetical protein
VSTEFPTVRETASLTVSEPVDGTRRRRASHTRRRLAVTTDQWQVDPRILAAAKAALRPGERLVLVAPGEVRTAYR